MDFGAGSFHATNSPYGDGSTAGGRSLHSHASEFTGRNLWTRSQGDDEDDCAPGPDEIVALRRDLERALKAMTEEDQAVLVPYFLYGYTIEQLAEPLGVSRSAVGFRIHAALRRTRLGLGLQSAVTEDRPPKSKKVRWLPDGIYRPAAHPNLLCAQLYRKRKRVWHAYRKNTHEGLEELERLLEQARKDHAA